VPLPGHADRPGDLGGAALVGEGRLQHAHRPAVAAAAHRPVALRGALLVGEAGGRQPGELVAPLLHSGRVARKEPVQLRVAEDLGQLLGVIGDDRQQLEPRGQQALGGRMPPAHPQPPRRTSPGSHTSKPHQDRRSYPVGIPVGHGVSGLGHAAILPNDDLQRFPNRQMAVRAAISWSEDRLGLPAVEGRPARTGCAGAIDAPG
jgi:hypothetical protein